MTSDRTASISSEPETGDGDDLTLIVALECDDLAAQPATFALAGWPEVTIERGEARSFEAGRLTFLDRRLAPVHARLLRGRDRWRIVDESGGEGIYVNGARVTHKVLDDGDVIECGGVFIVARRGAAPRELPADDDVSALRTMSPALATELAIVRKVARSNVPILIFCGPGSGEERIARAVHRLSGRTGAFVVMKSGASEPADLRSEELDGGTLFLDELDVLEPDLQAALRHLLEHGDPSPPAEGVPGRAMDVRVIAATRRPPDHFTKNGSLRRDLYVRLRGYELRLPPLFERREDLGLLVADTIRRYDRSGAPRTLHETAAAALFAYAWPNDLTELEDAVAAALGATSGEIGLEHLPRRVGLTVASRVPGLERDRLTAMMAKHRGNVSAIARELATSRTQIYRLLERHSIRTEDDR